MKTTIPLLPNAPQLTSRGIAATLKEDIALSFTTLLMDMEKTGLKQTPSPLSALISASTPDQKRLDVPPLADMLARFTPEQQDRRLLFNKSEVIENSVRDLVKQLPAQERVSDEEDDSTPAYSDLPTALMPLLAALSDILPETMTKTEKVSATTQASDPPVMTGKHLSDTNLLAQNKDRVVATQTENTAGATTQIALNNIAETPVRLPPTEQNTPLPVRYEQPVVMPSPTTPQHTLPTQHILETSPPPLLNARLGSPEWQQALSQQILLFNRNGQHQAELRLYPQELGTLQISLNINDNQAQLHLASAHSQVRAVLENALPQLRHALAESGIQLGQSSIGSDAQPQWGQNGESQRKASDFSHDISDNEREEAIETLSVVKLPHHDGRVNIAV